MPSSFKKVYRIINNLKIFNRLDDALKKELAFKSEYVESKEAEEIQVDTRNIVYIVAEGKAFLSFIEENGRKIILDVIEKENILGDLDFSEGIGHGSENLFIESFPKTRIILLKFSKGDFINILSADPIFPFYILSEFSHMILRLEKKIEELALYGLKTRLFSELIRLAEPDMNNNNFLRIDYKITHEKLAESTGSVRETVSRALSELKKEGFVFYDKKRNIIIDIEKWKMA